MYMSSTEIRIRNLAWCEQHAVILCALEPGVGLGIGACCLTLENSAPGIYIHSLAPGSVAKMDGRLRYICYHIPQRVLL